MPYIIGLAVIALVGVGFTLFQNRTENEIVTESQDAEVVTTMEAKDDVMEADVASTYTDGTYTTEVTYLTPARDEYLMDVTLTLENDIVVDSNIVYSQGAEKDPNPIRFEGAYKAEIIGKSLDEISLSRVGGASLTTNAFNNALVEIKSKAS